MEYQQQEPDQDVSNNEEVLSIPEGPITRSKSKKLKEAVTGLLKTIQEQEECLGHQTQPETFTYVEFHLSS